MTPSKAMQVSSLLILVITFPPKNKITEINHIIITTTLMLTPNGLDWERGRGGGARSAGKGKGGAGEVKGITGQSEAKLSGSVEGEAVEPLIFFIIIKKN